MHCRSVLCILGTIKFYECMYVCEQEAQLSPIDPRDELHHAHSVVHDEERSLGDLMYSQQSSTELDNTCHRRHAAAKFYRFRV